MQFRRALGMVLGVALAGMAGQVAAQEHAAHEHAAHAWGYSGAAGPAHWGEVKPEYAVCKTGQRQSPVDIEETAKADLPAIEFHYQASPLHIIDNGHSIQINYGPGSSMRVAGKEYALKQFHFHHPSEEKIHGKDHAMVAHLVHADAAGKLAVVAVLLDKGGANPTIDTIWKHLPKEKEKEISVDAMIDAAKLLPRDTGYYTFQGSLTTPPCSEEVTWFVLKHPVTESAVEVAQFAKLYPHNARPVQPLHGRVVQESK